jgi:hypothetical protein
MMVIMLVLTAITNAIEARAAGDRSRRQHEWPRPDYE